MTELASESLGKTLSGSGNLSESHLIGNDVGVVGIGVNIINSNHYDYTYLLKQGDTDISAVSGWTSIRLSKYMPIP